MARAGGRDRNVVPISPAFLERIIHALATQEWATTVSSLPRFVVRDVGLLDSTLAEPYQHVGGRALYPTVTSKAACLFRGLVKNHPLVDGNKRLAVTAMTVFLQVNGRRPTYTNRQLYGYALRVARQAGNYPVSLIEAWLRRNSEHQPAPRLAEMIMDVFILWQDSEWVAHVLGVQGSED